MISGLEKVGKVLILLVISTLMSSVVVEPTTFFSDLDARPRQESPCIVYALVGAV